MKIETLSAYLLSATVATNVASNLTEPVEAVPITTDEKPNVVEEGAIGANEVVQYTDTLSSAIPLKAEDFSSGGQYFDGVLPTGSYQLSENINLTKGIIISGIVELDLVTYTLNGSGITTSDKSVITVESSGDLTLQGSTGKVTGGSGTTVGSQQYGGGVYVKDSGSFTLESGTISSCTATSGAGVFLGEGATGWIVSGTISGNTASLYGGGVYMSNGTILNTESATITNNTANVTGGGLAIYSGTVNMGSSTKVSGNRNNDDISIVGSSYVSMINVFSGFTSSEKIYLSRYYADGGTATFQGGNVVSGASSSNISSFASTSDAFEVVLGEDGTVSLSAVAYTVTFYDPDNKTNISTETVKQGNSVSKPTDPTLDDYVFDGWYTDSTFSTEFDFNGSAITGNVTIYAKWKEVQESSTYTVTFDVGGGTYIAPQDIVVGGYAIKPVTPPVRAGYLFEGWYVDSDYTEVFDFDVRISGNTTVYAKWSEDADVTLGQFTVTFMNGTDYYYRQTVTEGDSISSPVEPVKEGYVFLGWYADAHLETLFDFSHTVIDSNTVIYSKWEADSSYYTVYFSTGLGTSVASQTVKDGNYVVEPASPSRTGYSFGGWYLDSEYEEKFSFVNDAVTENITLYAKWDLIVNATLTGFVMDSDGYGLAEASVRFVQNGRTVFQTETDGMGLYTINNPLEGYYNMVVTYGTTTRTILVTMQNVSSSLAPVIMSAESISSVVTILDSSVSVVGGIHSVAEEFLAEQTSAFTDLTAELKINSYYDTGFEDAVEEYKHRDHSIGRYYDLDLSKRVSSTSGYSTKTIDETNQLVSITIDLPSVLQNKDEYAVYMEVDGKMRELSTYANKDGEYIALMSNGTQLVVYTKHFAPIAVAYANPDLLGEEEDYDDDSSDDTGEFYLNLMMSLDGSYTSSRNPGTLTVSNRYPDYMEKVYLSTTTNLGYSLASVTAVNDRGETVTVRKVSDDLYYYIQDLRPVSVTAAFSSTYVPSVESVSKSTFDDVHTTDTFCSAVHEVVEMGLMSGTGLRTFSPYESVTRGMLVTILYQLAGETDHYGTTEFPDVSSYQYYSNAVAWAEYTGVVAGYSDGLFRPNQNVTREELAMIYYRFANYLLGSDTAAWLFPLEFNDVSGIHDFALESMTWAVNVNLLSERYQGFIVPQSFATRAEVATSLVEFLKLK